MSDTPMTDALEEKWRYATEARGNLQAALDDMFCEYAQLERELASANADLDHTNQLCLDYMRERDEAREYILARPPVQYQLETASNHDCDCCCAECKMWRRAAGLENTPAPEPRKGKA